MTTTGKALKRTSIAAWHEAQDEEPFFLDPEILTRYPQCGAGYRPACEIVTGILGAASPPTN